MPNQSTTPDQGEPMSTDSNPDVAESEVKRCPTCGSSLPGSDNIGKTDLVVRYLLDPGYRCRDPFHQASGTPNISGSTYSERPPWWRRLLGVAASGGASLLYPEPDIPLDRTIRHGEEIISPIPEPEQAVTDPPDDGPEGEREQGTCQPERRRWTLWRATIPGLGTGEWRVDDGRSRSVAELAQVEEVVVVPAPEIQALQAALADALRERDETLAERESKAISDWIDLTDRAEAAEAERDHLRAALEQAIRQADEAFDRYEGTDKQILSSLLAISEDLRSISPPPTERREP